MKKYYTFLLIAILCSLWSCSDNEDVTPSMKDEDRLEALIDKSNTHIMAFKEKYGTYVLYEFDQMKDFAYQFEQAATWRSAKLSNLQKEDVTGAMEFLENNFLNCYADTLKLNYFPRKLLICGKIYAGTLGISAALANQTIYHDAVVNINSMTIAELNQASLNGQTAERRRAYIQQLHHIYLTGYIVDVRRHTFVDNVFFDPSSKLYATKIDRTGSNVLDENYFMNSGFFFIESKEVFFPQQSDDLMLFVENMIKMDQRMCDRLQEKSLMRIKMQYVVRGLKKLGVDVLKINPLTNSFL